MRIFVLIALFVSIARAQDLPTFEPVPCPRSFASPAECGYVTVPENRSNPGARTVQLSVAIFRAESLSPAPDPVLFLDGGPGARTLDSFGGGLGSFLTAVNQHRDVIIFDYRGIGYSQPNLNCPEAGQSDDWLQQCHNRLVSEGIDLKLYTTRDNAADAADIITALGLNSYNVWGGSYGSSVAQALLRDHPERIRSVVITAVQPPSADLQADIPRLFNRTIDLIDEQCAADEACSEAFPGDMSEKLIEVIKALEANPVTFEYGDEMLTVDAGMVLSGMAELLKDQNNLPSVPLLVDALYTQNYDVVMPYALAINAASLEDTTDDGAWYSMRCTDSVLATTPQKVEAALAAVDSAYHDFYMKKVHEQIEACTLWGARVPTPADTAPAVSDIPVLLMIGQFDPYSSPQWINNVTEYLPNNTRVILPALGHYVTPSTCATNIFRQFVLAPDTAPDTTCVLGMRPLTFQTP